MMARNDLYAFTREITSFCRHTVEEGPPRCCSCIRQKRGKISGSRLHKIVIALRGAQAKTNAEIFYSLRESLQGTNFPLQNTALSSFGMSRHDSVTSFANLRVHLCNRKKSEKHTAKRRQRRPSTHEPPPPSPAEPPLALLEAHEVISHKYAKRIQTTRPRLTSEASNPSVGR